MCNCGNKREAFTALNGTGINNTTKKMWQDVWFVYTGESALTITGYISGKRYRFAGRGEQQLIDYRDAAAMMNVPVLKKIALVSVKIVLTSGRFYKGAVSLVMDSALYL